MPIPRTPRPRGPSPGGRKKLPPIGGARRTGSVQISRILERFETMLSDQPTRMKAEHAAELRAIQERNLAGTWTKSDLKRVQALLKIYFR